MSKLCPKQNLHCAELRPDWSICRLTIVDNPHNITPQCRVKLILAPYAWGTWEMQMPIAFDFSDRVTLITGAARGVGRAMVRQFAEAGSFVLAADRDEVGLAETVADLDPTKVASLPAMSRRRKARPGSSTPR